MYFCSLCLTNGALATLDACCMVVRQRVFSGNWDMLDHDLTRDELYATLLSMQNGKFLRLDGLLGEFYKSLWNSIGDDFCCIALEVFASNGLFVFLNQGLINSSVSGKREIPLEVGNLPPCL